MLGDFTHIRACKPFCEKYLTLPLALLGSGNPLTYSLIHDIILPFLETTIEKRAGVSPGSLPFSCVSCRLYARPSM